VVVVPARAAGRWIKVNAGPSLSYVAGAHYHRLLFIALLLCYILTASGYAINSDGRTMIGVANSLLAGHLDVATGNTATGVGAKSYSIYGLGWSLCALPLCALGLLAQHFVHVPAPYQLPVFFGSFLDASLIAGAAALTAAFVEELSGSRRLGLLAAMLFAFMSPAWVYSKDAYSEPLDMLCLLGAAYLLGPARTPTLSRAALAGTLLGTAVLTRLDQLPMVAVLIAYGGWCRERRVDWRWWSALLLPIAALTTVQLAYDYLRFGSVFATGYESAGYGASFKRTWGGTLSGLAGLLVDPTRGLVFTAPATLVAIVLAPGFFKLSRRLGFLVVAGFIVEWIVHANIFGAWEGGDGWGPRLLLPILPLLFLPIAGLKLSQPWAKWAVGALAVAGLVVTLPPVVVDYRRYYFASGFGQGPGPWPVVYLWKSLPTVVANGFLGRIPRDHLSISTTGHGAALVDSIPALSLPDFWWFFLLYGRIMVTATCTAVLLVMSGLALSWWLLRKGAPSPARLQPERTSEK
jgi:hypothetical protein